LIVPDKKKRLASGILNTVISCKSGQVGFHQRKMIQAATYLLLEIPPVFLVNEDQVQIIPDAKLLIHITERWRQVEATEEQPDRYRLA
jgi:hypothetical protein